MIVKKPSQKRKTTKSRTKKAQSISKELSQDHFRVAIFGSARIKENDPRYKRIQSLASKLGKRGKVKSLR